MRPKIAAVARVSAPSRKPSMREVPSASAASITARCEMDLSPGTSSVPRSGWPRVATQPVDPESFIALPGERCSSTDLHGSTRIERNREKASLNLDRCSSDLIRGKDFAFCRKPVQRRKQRAVFFLAADADAQALRQAVAGHRTHDHAAFEQRRLDPGGILAELDQQEVG